MARYQSTSRASSLAPPNAALLGQRCPDSSGFVVRMPQQWPPIMLAESANPLE